MVLRSDSQDTWIRSGKCLPSVVAPHLEDEMTAHYSSKCNQKKTFVAKTQKNTLTPSAPGALRDRNGRTQRHKLRIQRGVADERVTKQYHAKLERLRHDAARWSKQHPWAWDLQATQMPHARTREARMCRRR